MKFPKYITSKELYDKVINGNEIGSCLFLAYDNVNYATYHYPTKFGNWSMDVKIIDNKLFGDTDFAHLNVEWVEVTERQFIDAYKRSSSIPTGLLDDEIIKFIKS